MKAFADNTVIMQYVPTEHFFKIIENKQIYFSPTIRYEDTDINEGRFTNDFVDKLQILLSYEARKNYVSSLDEIPSREDVKKAVEGVDFERYKKVHLSNIRAMREVSYLSCWTFNLEESRQMWHSFGGNGDGVIIISTVRKIREALAELENESLHKNIFDISGYHVATGYIVYDRNRLDEWLNEDELYNWTFPLFFLEAGVYEHEQEFRFVIYESEELRDVAEDIFEEIELKGNILTQAEIFEIRRKEIIKKALEGFTCEIDLESVIDKIIMGPNFSKENEEKLLDLVEMSRLENKIKKSKFYKK